MFSDTRRLPEERGIPLAERNEVVEEVVILNERRRIALAEIDNASFSSVALVCCLSFI